MGKTSPPERRELLALLRQQPRGRANRERERIKTLIQAIERSQPADLSDPTTQELLEGIWELRWSSSNQPYLTVAPWLENLQGLAPSQGKGVNLLRLTGPLGAVAGIAVQAELALDPDRAQRVQVRFRRGGWVGPSLGAGGCNGSRASSNPSRPGWTSPSSTGSCGSAEAMPEPSSRCSGDRNSRSIN